MPEQNKIVSLPEPAKAPRRALAQQFRIGFLVHDVSRMRRTLYDQAMKPLGITRSQWWVLANLSRHEGAGMIQTELAKLVDVGKVTIGGLIDRLEASGHIRREPDAQDRRVKRITITDKGFDVLDKMSSVGRDLNKQILGGIPEVNVRVAEDVLHTMKGNLREMLKSSNLQASAEEDF